jgi:predicted nucleic acid-binding protein
MIYVDTSVVLAQLLAEDRYPETGFWKQELVSSRLLEYELWTGLHRRRWGRSHGEAAQTLVQSLAIVELSREVLRRAIEPFKVPVRTLDALHLATLEFLGERGVEICLATYDLRLGRAAEACGIELAAC